MPTITIPPEGFKIVCIIGMYEGNPIWRQVGKLTVAKQSGMPVVMIDTTFAAAGVHRKEQQSGSALLTCVTFSDEELEKKASYKQKQKPASLQQRVFNDDDDIPF
jgi:hypothetical protein